MGELTGVGQLFSIFVDILVPVFSLVLIGYLAGPRLGLDARTLSRLAYYILVPAFMFNIFSSAQIGASAAIQMALYMLIVTSAGILISWSVAKLLHRSHQMVAAYVLIAAFGNVGNFGLPIIQFKLGEDALVPAALYFLVASTFGFIVGVIAASWHKGSSLRAVRAALLTPAILAVLPALAVNWLDAPAPLFATRAFALLAAAMVPVMLLTLGVQLAGMGRIRLDRDGLIVTTMRLLVGPLLAVAIGSLFALSDLEQGAGIIQASMPAAVLTSLIALEHDLLPDFVTTVVLFSTLASAITLTAVLALV